MPSVWIDRILGLPVIPLLFPNLGKETQGGNLFFAEAWDLVSQPIVQIVSDPHEADVLLIPHAWSSVRQKSAYLANYATLAKETGKKIAVFAYGDNPAPVTLPNAMIFRSSQYRSDLQDNEIIMPAYAEDLLGNATHVPVQKSDVPSVGFCGWADYPSLKTHITTMLKTLVLEGAGLIKPRLRARIKGIVLRRRALNILQKSSLIRANFIIRSSYSGHKKTIGINPSTARTEYIANMKESDYALCIKGDGNYSVRFYEALSLGKIPVLLDTECVLPLEDRIEYDRFICRIALADLPQIDRIIADHFQKTSAEEWKEKQRLARETFERYLRIDQFFEAVFSSSKTFLSSVSSDSSASSDSSSESSASSVSSKSSS